MDLESHLWPLKNSPSRSYGLMIGETQYKHYGNVDVNNNSTFIQEVIDNIEQNFAFIAIMEKMDLRTPLLVIYGSIC